MDTIDQIFYCGGTIALLFLIILLVIFLSGMMYVALRDLLKDK